MSFTTLEIATHLGGEVIGDPSLVVKGFAPADRAQAGDLTFAENENYFARAEMSAASAIITDGAFTSKRKVLIKVANSRIAFAKVLPLFFPEPVLPSGIHPTAVIAPSAQVHPSVHVGPWCVIGEKVVIGARSVLRGGNHVGAGCSLGDEVHLFPNVVLYPNTELGARVRITRLDTGVAITAPVRDRGPFVTGRCVDLSVAAATSLGFTGLARVRVEAID